MTGNQHEVIWLEEDIFGLSVFVSRHIQFLEDGDEKGVRYLIKNRAFILGGKNSVFDQSFINLLFYIFS